MGRNGSGKTTFFETIMGLNPISSGSIKIDPEYVNKIKTIFQNADYDDELPIKDLYYFYSKMAGIKKINFEIFKNMSYIIWLNDALSHYQAEKDKNLNFYLYMEFHSQLIFLDEITTSLDYEW